MLPYNTVWLLQHVCKVHIGNVPILQAICRVGKSPWLFYSFSAAKLHGRPKKGVHQFTYTYINGKFSSTMYAVGQLICVSVMQTFPCIQPGNDATFSVVKLSLIFIPVWVSGWGVVGRQLGEGFVWSGHYIARFSFCPWQVLSLPWRKSKQADIAPSSWGTSW